MEIKSLAGTDFDTMYTAFRQAFASYEVQIDKDQLRTMLTRRGFNPELSFAAFEGADIVGFTFNGVGRFNGASTAYDTGTGTLKDYRGRGFATKIFEHSIPFLRDVGIDQYLLEVLQHNTGAVSVYRKLGFEVTREFNYFTQENGKVDTSVKVSGHFNVQAINTGNLDEGSVSGFWDFHPSWQNSFASIGRSAGDFKAVGVFEDGELLGYSIFEPGSGDITQLAVDKKHRRRGVASLLFREMVGKNRYGTIKAVNTDVLCGSITGFMKAKNIELRGRQFEMIKRLG